ncbi:hypothetical protein QQS21_002123 [Conoideocrella luteorostrata]|uniref:Rossmann-fold NAD(P)(+)-binding protein n=1 Tax=Conoideocrella luteorostrata TaxID=1105319 RepID=A0AAJ0CZT8_9HYPO|nr:hypothetical protein QQS21_002123 [Conoideocrella luteorostrata]
MGANSTERMAHIHELEMLRQEALRKTESITRDEEVRLWQLRLVTMRHENTDLREQLGLREFNISLLVRDTDQLRLDLEDGKQTVRAQEARLKKQDIEIASLKTEIESINGCMQDSGKALQEKFALARELDRLKPELEHLQSQLKTYQATVAEKNDLRRQLDSLEVELENEKRSRQRLQSKNNDAATAELASRLEDAEKKLAAEKKEREKAKKEHDRQLASLNAENERLEERITSLKEKSKTLQTELKEAKEQLEDVQTELATTKTRHMPRGDDDKPKKAITLPTDVGKKRRAPVMSFEEITIQTPGNDVVARERPTKKRGGEKTTVGEKSAFSVTPFLNRTKSLTDDSAQEESSNNVSTEADPESMSNAPSAPEPSSESEEEPPKPKVSFNSTVTFKSPAKVARPRGRPPKATPLGESTPAKTNRVIRSRGTPKVKSLPEISVDKSSEESSATDQENVQVVASKKSAPVLQSKGQDGDAKKKKRKLLGAANTTLFDDDDGEAVTQTKPQPVAIKRTRARLGGGVRNAFAAGTSFSPLKRDRRGVNASFLA